MRVKNQRQQTNGGATRNRCAQATQGQNRKNQAQRNGQGGRGRCRR